MLNLFVGFVEKQIFEQYTDPTPDYLGRYIDVCVGTASCSRGELEQFINYYLLQFTWEISETSVSFLDILISINGNRLVISVFYTDSHSYLLYSIFQTNVLIVLEIMTILHISGLIPIVLKIATYQVA